MAAIQAQRYNPSEDDSDVIAVTPVSSSLSVTSLAVMAETVLIKADNFNTSGKASKVTNGKDGEEKPDKPTKAPSWIKQLAAKFTGKSFSKEEEKLMIDSSKANLELEWKKNEKAIPICWD